MIAALEPPPGTHPTVTVCGNALLCTFNYDTLISSGLAILVTLAIGFGIALSIYGHRKILDIALGLLVISLIALVWRNRRRAPAPQEPVIDDEGFLLVEGHRTAPSHIRHGGEAD